MATRGREKKEQMMVRTSKERNRGITRRKIQIMGFQ